MATKQPKDFEITYHVPLPGKTRGGTKKYKFDQMRVGGSFYAKISVGELTSAAQYWGRKLGRKFTCRKEGAGARVWRIK